MAKNFVSGQSLVNNLAGNLVTGDSGDESVFLGVEFIFILEGQSFSGVVIGFTVPSSSELGLESLEIGVVLV